VSVAGSTAIDGISNWGVGDVIAFNGTTWQRIEGGADLNGVNLSVSGVGTFAAGTVTDPAITTAGDTDTGIYFPAADTAAVTVGGVEVARGADGKFGVGTTVLRQMLSIGGGGIRQTWVEVPVSTPTEIARATGLGTNANRGAVYKVNVVATAVGATTMVKEYIWMVQIFQSNASRTFTEIYSYENDLNAGTRDISFTVAASKTGDDEILTITVTSSGSSAPASADVSVYIEAYGGRDGLTQILT
jgi:hypothetical protein